MTLLNINNNFKDTIIKDCNPQKVRDIFFLVQEAWGEQPLPAYLPKFSIVKILKIITPAVPV